VQDERATAASQADTCRPLSKLLASAIEAISAVAASEPMPGTFSSLRLSSLLRCQAMNDLADALWDDQPRLAQQAADLVRFWPRAWFSEQESWLSPPIIAS
jgi:hypothetical protein